MIILPLPNLTLVAQEHLFCNKPYETQPTAHTGNIFQQIYHPYLFFIFGQLSIHVRSCIFAHINLVLHLFYISRTYFVYYLIFQSMC